MRLKQKPIAVIEKIFLATILVIGILLVPQFPAEYDEPSLRSHGTFNLVYAVRVLVPSLLPSKFLACNSFSCFPKIDDWNAYTHGAWFEMFLSAMEIPLGLENLSVSGSENTHAIFLMRHFCTFLFFWIGLVSFYYFAKREFKSTGIASILVVLYLTSPLIFGSAFTDTKNNFFMSMISISMNVMSLYARQLNDRKVILLGIVLGLTAGRRIVAVGLILLAVFLLPLIFRQMGKLSSRNAARHLLILFMCSLLTLYVSMPYLWSDPFHKFIKVFVGNANFQNFDALIRFNGSNVSVFDLPRSYLPVWMMISIPAFHLVMSLIGGGYFTWIVLRSKKVLEKEYVHISLIIHALFALICFVYVLVVNPVNYSGWGHFLFFHPILIAFAAFPIILINNYLRTKFKTLAGKMFVWVFVAIAVFPTVKWMMLNHPYQSGYFNVFAGKPDQIIEKWGGGGFMGNTEALRWILRNDSKEKISVDSMGDNPIRIGTIMLQESEKKRLCLRRYNLICQNSLPDYLIDTLNTNVNLNPTFIDYDEYNSSKLQYRVVHEITVDGRAILKVLKRYESQ